MVLSLLNGYEITVIGYLVNGYEISTALAREFLVMSRLLFTLHFSLFTLHFPLSNPSMCPDFTPERNSSQAFFAR
jgi:hypothetical protein